MDCIFCGRFIDKSLKSKEHIIPDCIGGRLKCRNVCRECNSKFGTEFERDLIESFGIIQDFLGLKSDGRNPKIARFTYKGRRVRLNKEGAQLVDTRYNQKENGTREHFFPNINSMRRYYEKEKLKDPTIDGDETIRKSDGMTTEIKSPLMYKTIFPFEKVFRACAKMIYEFLFSIRPNINFFKNFRDAFSQPEWDILRKAVYKKDYYKCSICGKENIRLEAHENWNYDYHQSIQKLISVDSLCYLCHRNKHLGHSGILIREGELNQEELISHWSKINNVNIKQFREYEEKVFELWNLKNKFIFKILDNKGINIYEGASLSNVLKLIADDYEN